MDGLTADEVRRIARLCRVALRDDEIEQDRVRLSKVLGYMTRLRELDTEGVEPMPHVGEVSNRLDEDEPGPTLPTEALMRMAPQTHEPFVKVPKVLGDGPAA